MLSGAWTLEYLKHSFFSVGGLLATWFRWLEVPPANRNLGRQTVPVLHFMASGLVDQTYTQEIGQVVCWPRLQNFLHAPISDSCRPFTPSRTCV